MNKYIVVLVFTLIQGCTVFPYTINCIDAKTAKTANIPIKSYEISLLNTHSNEMSSQSVRCEKYYNAQCSVRGNFWTWRALNELKPFKISSLEGKEIIMRAPYCSELASDKKPSIEKLAKETAPEGNYLHTENAEIGIYFVKHKTGKEYFILPIRIQINEI